MTERTRRWLWLGALLLLAVMLSVGYWWALWRPSGPLEWSSGGSEYELLEPRMLGVLLVLPVLLFVLGRSLADLPWQQRVLSVLLRFVFLALLALGLSRLVRTAESQRVCTVFLIDVSDSASEEAIESARVGLGEAIAQRREDDVIKVVTFAERPRLVTLEDTGSQLAIPPAASLRHAGTQDKPAPGAGTNLQAALQLAYGLFPPGTLRRVVVYSDGVETEGNVLAEAGRAKTLGVKVFARPYRFPPPGEVAVRALQTPPKVEIGQTFELVADVYSTRDTKARARLYQGDVLNGLDGVRQLELKTGHNEVRFQSVVRIGGEVTYSLRLDELGADQFPQNNQITATLDVPGRPAVLYVEGQPQRASYLSSALGAQQFDVDVRAPSAFPASIAELEHYDLLILSDVAAENVSLASQELIERYVRILGGGFVFAGGESGYGLGGWQNTTVERLLPVRMDVQRRKDIPSVALALVIDRSGSMTGLPMEMAKAACRATVGTLQGDDLVEVIAFDSTPRRYVKMQPARYRSRIQNEIARMQPGGGTAIFPALDAAYQDISVVQARKKHVILLTDGRADSQGIRDLIQAMIAESITVTAVGLGEDVDADLLRSIADAGGGRYHHVPDPNNLPRIFTRETEMISRQAAVQEWFAVQQVGNADFLRGVAVGASPLLHGYVATEMKPAPAQELLASDTGEPILARWRVGLGWAVAWTSDVKNQWAVEWLRWSGFGRFWGQLVREHMRQKHRRELAMRTEVTGGRARAVVDAFTVDDRFDNGIDAKLSVSSPAAPGARQEHTMRQTAPGRYEAEFPLDGYGAFVLRAEHFKTAADGTENRVGVSYGQIIYPYPQEYASFEPDLVKLGDVAGATGGAVDGSWQQVADPGGEQVTQQEPLWKRFLLAALVVYFFDLLVRRLRIFDRKFVALRRV